MKLSEEDEVLRINALIYTMGKEAEHIFKAFPFMGGNEKKYAKVIGKFNEHFVPKRNVIHERAYFYRHVLKGETVEVFVRISTSWQNEFGTQRDEQIRYRIVIGILDKSLSQKLQMKSDLNLDTAIQMACQSELVKFQVAGQSDGKHFGEVTAKERQTEFSEKTSP